MAMAYSNQARKRVRQNVRRAARNRPVRTRAARTVREARDAIEDGAQAAPELVRAAQSALDGAARHGVIHRNAAARTNSRLVRALKGAQAAAS